MNKEEKYMSLELAKELQKVAKENGFELPESEMYWNIPLDTGSSFKPFLKNVPMESGNFMDEAQYKSFRAYDTSELGAMLPKNIKTYWLVIIKFGGHSTNWSVRYMENLIGGERKKWHWNKMDESMPDAMGKMLCYLIKNKLI